MFAFRLTTFETVDSRSDTLQDILLQANNQRPAWRVACRKSFGAFGLQALLIMYFNKSASVA